MKLIKSLYRLSGSSGILALVNSRNNKVLLIRTSDALGALSRVLRCTKGRNKRYRELRKDINKLEIELVSEDNSHISLQYWMNYYESRGYVLYHKFKAIEYKVKVDVVHKVGVEHGYDVLVKLVSRNRKEVIVGVFDTVEEGTKFSSGVYPGTIDRIIYCNNERTREYMKKNKK